MTTSALSLALEAVGLTKAYHTQQVLRGVDLRVEWGQCLTLFGPNGSGKTTLLRTLSTLARHDGGTLRIAGYDPATSANAVRQSIGVLAHQTFLYDHLTAEENLRFYGRMFGVPDVQHRIDALITTLGLERFLHKRMHRLSHGIQKRVSLARALLHKPRVLLLDEPETGLDPDALRILKSIVRDHCRNGGSVFLTTHNIEEGLALADSVAILANGRIAHTAPAAKQTPTDFRALYTRVAGVPA